MTDPDPGEWSRFVDAHPASTIFHTPEMAAAFEDARRCRPDVWAAVDPEGRMRALFVPVRIAALGGPLGSVSSRSVAFAGPLVAPGPDAATDLRTLLDGYRAGASRASLFTEVRHMRAPAQAEIRELERAGFRHEGHLNYLVDMSASPDELWSRVASSARRNIRKAQDRGVEIVAGSSPARLTAAYEVLRDVYHRIQVPLPDRSLFEAAARILGPLGRFELLSAVVDGHTVGALTLLTYRDELFYWYTGTLRSAWPDRAGDLLVWRAIELGHERGLRVMDFGGAGRPDEPYGVREFKRKYGGALVDHGRDYWEPFPVRQRLTTAAYEALRRFL